MLPNVPLLSRRPLNGFVDGAHYDLDTMLLKHGFHDTIELPEIKSQSNDEFMDAAWLYHGQVVHEHMHWIQHHGTSFGSLVSLLKYSQSLSAIHWMLTDDRRSLLERRKRGHSMLRFNRDGLLQMEGDRHDEARATWYDHLWVTQVLLDSTLLTSTGAIPAEAFAMTLGDCLYTACVQCNLGHFAGHPAARRVFHFNESEIEYCALSHTHHLTVRSLLESHAVLSQLRNFVKMSQSFGVESHADCKAKTPWLAKHIDTTLRRLVDPTSEYGTAYCLFLELCGIPMESAQSASPTFCVACFAALNPPVPPRWISFEPCSWADFYPPIRFARLCAAVRRVGLLPDGSGHEESRDYLSMVVDAAGLPNIDLASAHPNLQRRDRIDFLQLVQASPFEPAVKEAAQSTKALFNYHEFVLWLQESFATLASHSLPLMFDLGGCMAGLYDQDIRTCVAGLSDDSAYFHPQMQWGDDPEQIRGTAPVSKEFRGWFFLSSCMYHLTTDIVAGTGGPDLSDYPPCLDAKEIVRKLNPEYRALFESEVW